MRIFKTKVFKLEDLLDLQANLKGIFVAKGMERITPEGTVMGTQLCVGFVRREVIENLSVSANSSNKAMRTNLPYQATKEGTQALRMGMQEMEMFAPITPKIKEGTSLQIACLQWARETVKGHPTLSPVTFLFTLSLLKLCLIREPPILLFPIPL